MRAATAQNINKMNVGPILFHITLYPLQPGIKFSPWKRDNILLQNFLLFLELSKFPHFHTFLPFPYTGKMYLANAKLPLKY